MPKVTLIQLEDWEQLYVDGELKWEGHRPYTQDVVEAIGCELDSRYYDYDTKVAKRATYDLIPNTIEGWSKWEEEPWEEPE